MTPGERITAKREIATLLASQEWGDIDFTLSEHDLPTTDMWNGGGKYGYVIAMMNGTSDSAVELLHAFVTGSAIQVKPGSEPWRGGQLRLFMSHLASHEAFIGDIASWLEGWGARGAMVSRLRPGW